MNVEYKYTCAYCGEKFLTKLAHVIHELICPKRKK
jgi:DNA-directed RNA polymerase subunit RPC12/RpoP